MNEEMKAVDEKLRSFSIVIPAYNAASTIGRCIRGFRDSGYPAELYEVIVADDGSSDRTVETASALGARVVRTAGKTGPGGARNRGAREARMDYLLFIDSDIAPSPETIWKFNSALERFPQYLAIQAIYAEGDYDNILSRYQHSWFYYFYRLRENYPTLTMSSSCLAIPREEFFRAGMFNPLLRTNEDTEFGYRLARLGKKILICTDIEVFHDRRFTLISFCRRNYFVHNFILVRLAYGMADITSGNPEYRVPVLNLITTAAVAPALLLFLVLPPAVPVLVLLALLLYGLWLNRHFLGAVRRRFGANILPGIWLALQVDNAVKVAGIFRGAWDYYVLGHGRALLEYAAKVPDPDSR